MTRRQKIAAAATLGCVLLAGTGAWLLVRRGDPLNRAEQFIARGDLRSAQVELRNALRARPRDPDAHLRMARLQMKLADPVAAEKEFKVASSLGADRWEVIPQLGEAMLAQGQTWETLDLVPARGPSPEVTAKLLLLRGIAQIGLKDLRAADRTQAEAEAAAPGRPETALIAARVAAARNDLRGTQAKVDEVLRLDPRQIDALLMRERLLTSAGDRPGALSYADRAVQSAPWSAMARMARANQLIFAGQDQKAQADVDAVLEVQPRFVEGIYLNAVLLARRGKLQDAAGELVKLEGAASRFPQALYYQALVATNLGQFESAAEYARRYALLAPSDPDGQRMLARAELAAKRPAQALAVLQKAVAEGQEDPETLDLLGRVYVTLGNTPAAMGAFEKAASLAPQDAAILTHLGLAQFQQGRAADATATLERSVGLAPGLQTAGAALVAASLGVGDIPKAEAALARLRKEAGDSEAVGILTGMVRLRRLDLDGAAAAFTETLRQYPNSLDARLHLARVAVQQGRRRAGLSMMNDVLARDPANVPALNAYLPLLVEDGQLPPAIQALEAARKADPKQQAFTVMLSDALVMAGNAARAATLMREAIGTANPAPPALLGALARAQSAAGTLDAAAASWRALLAQAPADLGVRGALVDLQVRTGQVDAARATLREGLKSQPGNIRMMTTLVTIDATAGGLDVALRTADALRADPANMPFAAALKGDLLLRAGRAGEAVQAFEQEWKATPSTAMLLRLAAARTAAGQDEDAARELRAGLAGNQAAPEVAQMLAQLDIKAKRWDDAKAHLALVLDRRPDDPFALNNLAWTYLVTGDGRARATAQRAYLLSPTADAADTLGWIMVREGAAKAAVPLLQRASEQRPDDASIRYHLAAALKADGQTDEAATLLRALVAKPAAFEDRAAAQALLDEMPRRN